MDGGVDYLDRFRCQQGLISWNAAEFGRCRLNTGFARILHVAALLEEDTAITVRQGDSLGLDRVPDLAVFLPQWDVEEAEHGRALRALLAYQEYEPPQPSPPSVSRRRRLVARVPAQAVGRLPQAPFLFCVLGAAAEYVATILYAELAKRSDAPQVTQLLRSIARQEARHFAFFLAAARVRGHRMSAVNGRLSRSVLRAIWEPIGVPTLGTTTWHTMFGGWLEDEHFRHRIVMMDRIVDSIPHLEGARLMAAFLDSTCTVARG